MAGDQAKMVYLPEQQLRDLLKEAWEDGAYTFWDGYSDPSFPPNHPNSRTLKERDELFDKLIASV